VAKCGKETFASLSQDDYIIHRTTHLSEECLVCNKERIIMNMFTRNFTLEQIADATEKTVDEVKQIIDSKQAVLV
jgi:hypothetical protein